MSYLRRPRCLMFPVKYNKKTKEGAIMQDKDVQNLLGENLEKAITNFSQNQSDKNNYSVLNAIVNGVMKGAEVIAVAGFDNMPDPSKLKGGMELSGLHFIKFNLDDKSYFVMYSSEEKTNAFTCPSMLRCSLYQFLVNAKHEEDLTGIIINPGPENYVMTKDAVIGLLDYIYELNKPYKEIQMTDDIKVNIPKVLEEVDAMPEDPESTRPFVVSGEGMEAVVLMYPIGFNQTMPLDYPRAVIDGIHNCLDENQGLIEVKNGSTKNGYKYLYSIVKTVMQGQGAQYCLAFDIAYREAAIHFQGYFDEKGISGSRDAYVFEIARRENLIDLDNNMLGWSVDPYDADFNRGILRNLSEAEDYDEKFPEHPLSKARSFVKFIVENN